MNNDKTLSKLDQTIIQVVAEKKPKNIKQLISLVKESLQVPEQEISQRVLNLQSEGKISFTRPQPSPSLGLGAYLKTEQAFWYWATIATAIITIAVVFTIPEDLYPWVYGRYLLGAIFVLWLPGYTLVKALFPVHVSIKLQEENTDTLVRVALSLGMSLALIPTVGLLLNYTPWGIRLTPIVLSLFTMTLVFATVGIIREQRAKMESSKRIA